MFFYFTFFLMLIFLNAYVSYLSTQPNLRQLRPTPDILTPMAANYNLGIPSHMFWTIQSMFGVSQKLSILLGTVDHPEYFVHGASHVLTSQQVLGLLSFHMKTIAYLVNFNCRVTLDRPRNFNPCFRSI